MPAPQFLLVSYQRSGNHLFRAILEFAYSRPTLGTDNTTKDGPIFLREPNRKSKAIDVRQTEPVAYKAHSLGNVMFWHRRDPTCLGSTILLLRDPVDAIASQMLRSRRWRWFFTERQLQRSVVQQVDLYLEPVFVYLACPPANRLCVKFENIVSDPSADYVNGILGLIGCPRTINQEELQSIKRVAKESQKSLRPVNAALKARIRHAIQQRITIDDVNALLNADWQN